MELYRELLLHYLLNASCEVRFPDIQIEPAEIINTQCYKALCQIKEIIENDHLNDTECFQRIESILQALESAGISCGARHDFG